MSANDLSQHNNSLFFCDSSNPILNFLSLLPAITSVNYLDGIFHLEILSARVSNFGVWYPVSLQKRSTTFSFECLNAD